MSTSLHHHHHLNLMDYQPKTGCIIIAMIIYCANFYIPPCSAQDREQSAPALESKNPLEVYGEGKNSFLNLYQKWISPVKGESKCPMYPSCSQYAKIAFLVLPWYEAYTKSCERLLRCGKELYLYPTIRINGEIRWYDPIAITEIEQQHEISSENFKPNRNNVPVKDETLSNRESDDEGFANFLVERGEYYRAITEYYRLIYSATDSTQIVSLLKKIGLCYFRGADYQGYISFFEKNRIYFTSNAVARAEMILYLGKSYYHLNQYQKTISTLEWSNYRSDNLFFNESRLLSGISYARLFDWQKAIEELELIQQDYPGKKSSENITRSLQNFPKLPQKSQVGAGILSAIIPGSGYIYCSRVGTGITSFILNGLLIWTVGEAISNEQYGLASAAGFLGIGWYVGNIKGSIDAAHLYNANIRNRFIDRLLEEESLFEYKKN